MWKAAHGWVRRDEKWERAADGREEYGLRSCPLALLVGKINHLYKHFTPLRPTGFFVVFFFFLKDAL